MALETSYIIKGFGRQRVYPPVGRCIYCFTAQTSLGDEHIIPQALGGNVVLPKASCRLCEKIVGGELEGRVLHKTRGPFASMRLREGYKSKRPKERPTSITLKFFTDDGKEQFIQIPAHEAPRYWMTFITPSSPGKVLGKAAHSDPSPAALITQFVPEDLATLSKYGNHVSIRGSGTIGDLSRFIAKIAHGAAVAEYGLDGFDAWLPEFILGNDVSNFDYFVAGHENATAEREGDHKIMLGTWDNDGIRLGALVRLFCKYGGPDYTVAVGQLKIPFQQPASAK